MRKNVLISGIILLLIGTTLFFAAPYAFKSALNLGELLPFRNSYTLEPNSSIILGSIPPGKMLVGIYNDTPLLALKLIGNELNVTKVNGNFVFESYNTESSALSVYAMNNYSSAVVLYYSVLVVSPSDIVYSTLMVMVGGILMIVGGIVVVIGLFMKPKKPIVPP
jgi:hypothetical protein